MRVSRGTVTGPGEGLKASVHMVALTGDAFVKCGECERSGAHGSWISNEQERFDSGSYGEGCQLTNIRLEVRFHKRILAKFA